MAIYDRQIATATRLVAKYGQSVVWRKVGILTPDPSQPWENTNGTTVDNSVKMVFLTKWRDELLLKYLKGTDIPTGANFGLMGVQSFVPAINDYVVRGSDNYIVKDIDIISPNGTPILYIVSFAR